MSYNIYVIGNADLFREGFNAIAAFCGSKTFSSATHIASLLSVIMSLYGFYQSQKLMVFAKWAIGYWLVFNVLLGTPSTVYINNTSDPTAVAGKVEGVPFGIAYPASMITSMSHAFILGFEEVFSVPGDRQYSKTGMLFGSNLFRMALSANIDDPEIMSQMNDYIRSCAVGDILINHKYTLKDLLNSKDLWGLVTSNPSPIRGVFVRGVFKSCKEEAGSLTESMDSYLSSAAPNSLSRLIPSSNAYTGAAVSTMLASSYNYFQKVSKTGTEILKQNIAINAFRSGLKNYAAEVGSVAGMENISNTMAMNTTRMAWSSSRHIGVQTLPLMQVVLLLLMLCVFPFVAILSIIPGVGSGVIKNYLFSLLWLESWPIMYAILNMAMNFHVQSKVLGTVTLSNVNLIAQEHSDIAGIAGYFILAIPFLSIGLVKGMAMAFSSASNYLGGMMHSISQGSSSAVTSGNYSLGNVSTDNATSNNISANKHDINSSNMHGMSTEQLANGSSVTHTASGANVYNTHGAMSQLASKVSFSKGVSSRLTERSDAAMSSATNSLTSMSHAKGYSESLGDSSSSSEKVQATHGASHNLSMANALMEKEGGSLKDNYSKLSQAGVSFNAGFSANKGAGATAGVSGDIKLQGSSGSDESYYTGVDKNISASDAKAFSSNESHIKDYAKTHTVSSQNSDSENLLIQAGTSLNRSQTFSEGADYAKSNSASIDQNMAQSMVSKIEAEHPGQAESILSATDGPGLKAQEKWISSAMDSKADEIFSSYQNAGREIQAGERAPEQVNMDKYAVKNYENNSGVLSSRGENLGVNKENFKSDSSLVESNIKDLDNDVSAKKDSVSKGAESFKESSTKQLFKEQKGAQEGILEHMVDDVKSWF